MKNIQQQFDNLVGTEVVSEANIAVQKHCPSQKKFELITDFLVWRAFWKHVWECSYRFTIFYIYGLKHVFIDTQDDPLATIYSKWHDNVYVSAFTKAEFSKLLKYVSRVVCCTSIVRL